jgi:hypothetical protein
MPAKKQKLIPPDEQTCKDGTKLLCKIHRQKDSHSGTVTDDQGVVRWRYGVRKTARGPWRGNPWCKPDFFIHAEGDPAAEIVIRRVSFIPSIFEIIEGRQSIGRIRMRSLFRIKYAIEIAGAEALTFRLPLFTVRFWGSSEDGVKIWVMIGPSKMEWNILFEPGLDVRKTIAAVSFIHTEWWHYS